MKNINNFFSFSVTELSQIYDTSFMIYSEGSSTGKKIHKHFFDKFYIEKNGIYKNNIHCTYENYAYKKNEYKKYEYEKTININFTISEIKNGKKNNKKYIILTKNTNKVSDPSVHNITITGKIDFIDHKNKKIVELKTINLRSLYNFLVYKNKIKSIYTSENNDYLKSLKSFLSKINENNIINENNNINKNNNIIISNNINKYNNIKINGNINKSVNIKKINNTNKSININKNNKINKSKNFIKSKNLLDDPLINFKFQLFTYGYIFNKIYNLKGRYSLVLILFDPVTKEQISLSFNPDYRKFVQILKKRLIFFFKIKKFESKKFKNEFLFPYNNINDIQRNILNNLTENNKKFQFIEAPFGSGKTTIILFSILKKFDKKIPKIIYLTSKNIQKNQIKEEAKKYNLNCIVLKSIESECMNKLPYCIKKRCKYYPKNISIIDIYQFDSLINQYNEHKNHNKNYVDNYIIDNKNKHTNDYINNYINNYLINNKNKNKYKNDYINNNQNNYFNNILNNFCIIPFRNYYYKFYDIIIADYNYLFFNNFTNIKNQTRNGIIIVIDEFHSFLKRLKGFFTIKISKNEIEQWINNIYTYFPYFPSELLNNLFENQFFNFNTEYNKFDEENFTFNFEDIELALQKIFHFFENIKEETFIDIYKNLIFPLLKKIEIILLISKFELKSATYTNGKKIITYKNIKKMFNYLTSEAKMVIGISATLNPKNQIYELIDNDKINIISINEKKQINVFIKKGIETTFKKRKYYYSRICNFILNNTINEGIYLIFLPSYKFIYEIEIFFYGTTINKIVFKKPYNYNCHDNSYNNNPNIHINNNINNTNNNSIKYDNYNIHSNNNNCFNHNNYLNYNNYNNFNNYNIYNSYNNNYSNIIIPKMNNFENYQINDLNFIKNSIIEGKKNFIFIPYNSILSEGVNIDFHINSIFCVGLPYPVIEEKYITHYQILKEEEKNPYKILSLFPAINEILQVSGRIGRYNINNKIKNHADQAIYFIGNDFLKPEVYENIENYYSCIKIID